MGYDITFGVVTDPRLAIDIAIDECRIGLEPSIAITRPQVGLLDLPVELVVDILRHVPWEDYYSVKQSSHVLRDLADAPRTLSEARYTDCTLATPRQSSPELSEDPSIFRPPQIHKILSSASIRRGRSYFSSSSRRPIGPPIKERGFGQNEIPITGNKSRVSRSPFRHDSLCNPSAPKINVIWVLADEGYSSSIRYRLTRYDTPEGVRARTQGVREPRDDLESIVGTGFTEEGGEAKRFVTVDDLFKSFQRCRPEFGRRKSGRVKFGATCWRKLPDEANGEEGMLEVRWRWISEGFDEKIIRSLAGYPG